MPVVIPARRHFDLVPAPFETDHGLDPGEFPARVVDILLERHDRASPPRSVAREDDPTARVVDPIDDRARTKPPKITECGPDPAYASMATATSGTIPM